MNPRRWKAILLVGILAVLGTSLGAALIGVHSVNRYPRTNLGPGTLTFDAVSRELRVVTHPTSADWGVVNGFYTMSNSEMRLQMRVLDNAGQSYEGSPVAFTLEGTLDGVAGGSGVLLTGELVEFGFHNPVPTTPERPTGSDEMDWRFRVTGGLLAPYYAGQNIGVYTVLENDGTWPVPGSATNGFPDHFASSFAFNSILQGYIMPIKCGTAIGDFVWNDLNANGIQEPGEPGINGVVIRLKDSNGAVVATTTTGPGPLNQQGYYQFTNMVGLCAGTWSVEYDASTVPAAFVPTVVNAGGNAATDSNPNPSLVVLTTDVSKDQTHDFGFTSARPGEIGDYVWHDLNRDGLQDAGEPGLGGVGVQLLDNATNAVLATTSTAGDGSYLFGGLNAGSYRVEVQAGTLPPGFTPTPSLAGSPAVDSNGSPAEVPLAQGESNRTIDFGYLSPCTGVIGDFVWYDRNQNGMQDVTEPGLVGVTVRLYAAGGALIATTATAADGAYSFTGLCGGEYRVEIDGLPSGFTLTVPNAPGSTSANDSNPNPDVVTLPSDFAVDTTIDFGLKAECKGEIGDFVWHDENRNGIQDAGEIGFAGATVNLRNAADNSVIQTSITDGTGAYLFVGLCPGSYLVEIVPPPGTSPSPVLQGGDTSLDSNPNPFAVTLPWDDSSDRTVDFGLYCTGEVGDFVWNDLNNNGIQDAGEPGIPGVTLILTDSHGDHTTVTDASGHYLFTGRCAGPFSVTVVPPADYLPAPSNTGGDDNLDSDGPVASGNLPQNDSRDDSIDFGFFMPRPAIDVTKDATPSTYDAVGQLITYSYTVTNTGNVTLSPVTVNDDKLGELSGCESPSLAPGGSTACTATHAITQADLDAGFITNVVAAVGTYGHETVSDSDTETVTGLQTPPACIIPSVTISNTSWNSFKIPAGTQPVVWVHAHIGKPAGIPTTTKSTVRFTGGILSLNATPYALPDGLVTFDPSAPAAITTTFNAAENRWETLVNPTKLSDEIFFTGAAIPVTPQIAAGAKATWSYSVSSSVPNLAFPWQWSAAVYTYWPSNWNQAAIQAYHASYHAGTPLNTTVQQSLIAGPRGGGGSNYTGSWSATGSGSCPK